jgi:O-antigen/teichoic acid export membrane protein
MISYLSVVAIGLFSFSLKLASLIQLLNIAFIAAWNPFMFEQFKRKNNKQVFVKFLPIVACVVYSIVVTISLFSKEIVSIIAHKEFSESYKYVGALCLYFSIYIFKEIVDIGPKFIEKTKYLSYSFIISLLVNFISLFFLIKYFELKGVVLSMILSNIFLLILSWYFSNKLYYIPHKIINFLILSIPAFTISIGIMYIEIDIINRFLIFILTSIFYIYFFIAVYKNNNDMPDDNNLSINI